MEFKVQVFYTSATERALGSKLPSLGLEEKEFKLNPGDPNIGKLLNEELHYVLSSLTEKPSKPLSGVIVRGFGLDELRVEVEHAVRKIGIRDEIPVGGVTCD